VTPDDAEQPLAARAKRRDRLVFRRHGLGNGAKSLGQELAGTHAFAQCQVTKVFRRSA
jgi:hypothetical protein